MSSGGIVKFLEVSGTNGIIAQVYTKVVIPH